MKPPDEFEKRLRLAGQITARFRERGWNLIVVGGSAIEFYTEGQYLSGDIDVCRRAGQKPIPPSVERDVMLSLNAAPTGTRRQWKVDGVFIDLLGEVETARNPVFRFLETPNGPVQIMPAEEVLVERVFVAYSKTPPDPDALAAAEKMTAAALRMRGDFDWDQTLTIARSSDYGIGNEVQDMMDRISRLPIPPRKDELEK